MEIKTRQTNSLKCLLGKRMDTYMEVSVVARLQDTRNSSRALLNLSLIFLHPVCDIIEGHQGGIEQLLLLLLLQLLLLLMLLILLLLLEVKGVGRSFWAMELGCLHGNWVCYHGVGRGRALHQGITSVNV